MDKEVPAAIRMGIGEILREARLYMREKRLAHDGFQELQDVYARRLAQEKEDAMRNAKELADVMSSVEAFCMSRATKEVEDEESLSRRIYRRNITKRKRRARRRRNRTVRYAAMLATIGGCEQIIVHASATGDAGEGLLVLAFLFYVVSACLMVYAHYYLGPRSIRPWRPTDPKLLRDKIQLRTSDLLTKWENEQKHKRSQVKQHPRDRSPRTNMQTCKQRP